MLRMKMIEISLQYRPENDLVDEFLDLANLYVKRHEIKEATQLFNRVMQIDPKHLKARQKLDEALAMESGMAEEIPAIFVARKRKTSTQSKGDDAAGAAVLQAIENYQNILKMNPRNAAAHLKLAGLYRQQQNESRALQHLDLASELFLARGELSKVVETCEQSLALKPNNAAIRERLAKAILQRDSLEAIERVMGHEGE